MFNVCFYPMSINVYKGKKDIFSFCSWLDVKGKHFTLFLSRNQYKKHPAKE